MDRQELINGLSSSLRETLALFDRPAADLAKRYGPGKWSAREILIHLADAEAVLLERLRRILSEKAPLLLAFDQDRWVTGLRYDARDLSVAKLQFQAARQSLIELIKLAGDAADSKTGMHSENGPVTFGHIIQMVQRHTLHHLEQVRAALEGREWKKAG